MVDGLTSMVELQRGYAVWCALDAGEAADLGFGFQTQKGQAVGVDVLCRWRERDTESRGSGRAQRHTRRTAGLQKHARPQRSPCRPLPIAQLSPHTDPIEPDRFLREVAIDLLDHHLDSGSLEDGVKVTSLEVSASRRPRCFLQQDF